jgi:hypothetical protein
VDVESDFGKIDEHTYQSPGYDDAAKQGRNHGPERGRQCESRSVGMNESLLRRYVVGVDLFEATSAILGAAGLVIGFVGVPLSVLSGTLFADFTVPALLLGFVVGGSALAAES